MPVYERVERYVPLDDLQVRTEAGQRIIDAYAAVFDVEQEIRDREGHYMEKLARSSFDTTIAARQGNFQVVFNHGKTIHGTPSERYSLPYGKPVDGTPRADTRGVFTSTRVSNTPLGDELLQLADDGVLRGQSFSGAFRKTETTRNHPSGLPLKTRTEVALTEYGLTPFPYYQDAHVVGIRSQADELLTVLTTEELTAHLLSLPDDARAELLAALQDRTASGASDDGPSATGHLSGYHPYDRERLLKLAGA